MPTKRESLLCLVVAFVCDEKLPGRLLVGELLDVLEPNVGHVFKGVLVGDVEHHDHPVSTLVVRRSLRVGLLPAAAYRHKKFFYGSTRFPSLYKIWVALLISYRTKLSSSFANFIFELIWHSISGNNLLACSSFHQPSSLSKNFTKIFN